VPTARRRRGDPPGAPVLTKSRLITFAGLVLIVVAVALSLVTSDPDPAPAAASATQGMVDLAPTVPPVIRNAIDLGPGYWLTGSDGGVFAYGRAHFSGGAAGSGIRSSIAGLAVTPTGKGYWLAGRDGGVFAYGDAPFQGGVAGLPLNKSIVAIVGSPTGKGYWLAGSDGGVFAFGDAAFAGALGPSALNQPIVAMAATPSGKGYWLVAKDGGVFAFGDAPFLGGASGVTLTRGIVGIASSATGQGYWLAGGDGGIFSYGDAGFYGSAIGALPVAPIVGMTATVTGRGYWLAGSDGGVFAFGDAGYYGSPAEDGVRSRVVAVAAGVGTDVRTQNRALSGTYGWDVSWPQCSSRLPEGGYAFAVVGVTNGHAFSENPCLTDEFNWALRHNSVGSLYANVNWPSVADEGRLAQLEHDKCPPADVPCQAYWWGRRGAEDALAVATRHHVSAPMWWLDVETTNRWTPDPALNSFVVKGAIEAMQAAHVKVGVYSSQYQWNVVVGGYSPGLPTWVAGPMNAAQAPAACAPAKSFGGGTPWLVQFPNGLDGNIACEAGAHELLASFRLPPPPAVPQFPADVAAAAAARMGA
jgi:hypothetical protein